MREPRLSIKLSDCKFGTQRVQYLGFVLEPTGVWADQDEGRMIADWPQILMDRPQLRGFVDLMGYCRRVIPDFNKIAHPSHGL